MALYVFSGLHFIGFYLLCHETISYGRRNTCISVSSSNFLTLNSLIPYLGKIIFLASDWTAVAANKLQHGSKQIRGSYTVRGYMLLVLNEQKRHIKSGLSLIVQVNVVLNRTVVVDND